MWILGPEDFGGLLETTILQQCRQELFRDSSAGHPELWGFGALSELDFEIRVALGDFRQSQPLTSDAINEFFTRDPDDGESGAESVSTVVESDVEDHSQNDANLDTQGVAQLDSEDDDGPGGLSSTRGSDRHQQQTGELDKKSKQ